jgi:3',5'-cyclic AMP phosphodiesterase CpdA
MRVLAHISDLHFGTELPEIIRKLPGSLEEVRPDLLVVSGDLTQRARAWQFRAAKAFLDGLPFSKLIVPGNHDVPLYNVVRRFSKPLEHYRNIITQDLSPFFSDGKIAVLGVNTARSLTWKNGRISVEQMEHIREKFCSVPQDTFKVLVTHHPFIAPPGQDVKSVVGRAERMFLLVEGCNPDLALAGHFHMSYSGGSHAVYTAQKRSTLVVQAGTATSGRIREEQNAYNVLRIMRDRVELSVRMWDGRDFAIHRTETFGRDADGKWEVIAE